MWVPSATSMRNSLSTGRALGGRNRHPERGSTRGVRSWGYTSLGIEGCWGQDVRGQRGIKSKEGKPELGEGIWRATGEI